ncbi:uncharacterized protein LOC119078842 [Bradysia coprophila]|uniref:uncharacterized protein LOC119078842 n=1 Tax=Bradysia coprophila TaxID=38358 RepID=UPI00187DD27B|nr:uncharacterized protein LOC119078842 [Bradysia coprophila]
MSLTLVTVMLYASPTFGPNLPALTIGGLNDTEMLDLKTITSLYPENSEIEMYGTWSVNFRLGNVTSGTNSWMALPPVHTVAPFISRIKTWGYKITFYNCYTHNIQFDPLGNTVWPILSYTWMLEKDSELAEPPREN